MLDGEPRGPNDWISSRKACCAVFVRGEKRSGKMNTVTQGGPQGFDTQGHLEITSTYLTPLCFWIDFCCSSTDKSQTKIDLSLVAQLKLK